MLFEPFAGFERRLRESSSSNSPIRQVVGPENSTPGALPSRPAPPLWNSVDAQQKAKGEGHSDVVNFTAFALGVPGYEFDLEAEIQSAVLRLGRVWFHVRYRRPNAFSADCRTAFFGVDAETGSAEAIPLPKEMGVADPHPNYTFNANPYYEITDDSLIVSTQDRLQQYRFREKTWQTLPVPMEHGARIVALDGRLFLTTQDSVLEVRPDSNKIEILASARRRPPANPLDSLGPFGLVSKRPDGKVALSAAGRLFVLSERTRSWEEIQAASAGVRRASPATNRWWVNFGTEGRAMLVHAGPGAADRAQLPVRFEKEGQPINPERPREVVHPSTLPPDPLQFDTPKTVVVASRTLAGFWLIDKSAFEARAGSPANATRAATTPGTTTRSAPAAAKP
jgi:hypothetical protein